MLRVQGPMLRVQGSMLRAQGSMLRVQGSMLRVQGSKGWALSLSKCNALHSRLCLLQKKQDKETPLRH